MSEIWDGQHAERRAINPHETSNAFLMNKACRWAEGGRVDEWTARVDEWTDRVDAWRALVRGCASGRWVAVDAQVMFFYHWYAVKSVGTVTVKVAIHVFFYVESYMNSHSVQCAQIFECCHSLKTRGH